MLATEVIRFKTSGEGAVENLAHTVDKEEKIGMVVINRAFLPNGNAKKPAHQTWLEVSVCTLQPKNSLIVTRYGYRRGDSCSSTLCVCTKSAFCLAELNAHMNESGLLTVLLTVYGLECPQKVKTTRTLRHWNCYYSHLESKCQEQSFFKWQQNFLMSKSNVTVEFLAASGLIWSGLERGIHAIT